MAKKSTPSLPEDKPDKVPSLFDYLDGSQTFLRKCPYCKGEYKKSHMQILEQNDPAHLIHVNCPHCSCSLLVIVALTDIGLSSIGLYTDLTAEDVCRLYYSDPVSEDEVLSFHTFIQQEGQHVSKHFVC